MRKNIVRGHKIKILKGATRRTCRKKLDVDVVPESTGFTSRDKAELQSKAGAKRVLISAPAKIRT
jgi:glyceraldehyde-3-phosphate dehydrogenase/erythrose-4-phosphate dehydrogenase